MKKIILEQPHRIVELYQQGTSVKQIAHQYQIPLRTMYDLLRRQGASLKRKSKITSSQKQEMFSLYRQGQPIKQLMAQFQLSRRYIHQLLVKNKIEIRNKNIIHKQRIILTQQLANQIREDYAELDAGQLAYKYQVNPSTIYNILRNQTYKKIPLNSINIIAS